MPFSSVEQILHFKQEAFRSLQTSISTLNETELAARPLPGAWSVNDICEHLALAETSLLQLIESLLKKGEQQQSFAGDGSWEISIDHLIEKSRNEKYQARENIQPKGELTRSESMKRLEEIHTRLMELQPQLQIIDPKAVEFPHPIFGKLNLGQWLAFIGLHEERHIRQIKERTFTKEHSPNTQGHTQA